MAVEDSDSEEEYKSKKKPYNPSKQVHIIDSSDSD